VYNPFISKKANGKDGDSVIKKTDSVPASINTIPETKTLVKNLEAGKVVVIDEKPKTTIDTSTLNKETKKTGVTFPQKENDLSPLKRKELSESAKEHFEANSAAFVAFAKQKEGGDNFEKNEKKSLVPATDLWERALLLEEYPEGRKPIEIEPKIEQSFPSVPKKSENFKGDILPTRIISETEKSHKTPKTEAPVSIDTKQLVPIRNIQLARYIPKKPATPTKEVTIASSLPTPPKKTDVPTSFVPKKPVDIKQNIVEKNTKNHNFDFEIPKKQVSTIQPLNEDTKTEATKNHEDKKGDEAIGKTYEGQELRSPNETEMSDILKEKIIEGQLKGLFENAPEGLKTTMEKMPALTVLSAENNPEDPNETWKTRLREYIIKLKWQGKTVFENTGVTDPKEDEMVIDYIKRIYPAIVRAEIKEKV